MNALFVMAMLLGADPLLGKGSNVGFKWDIEVTEPNAKKPKKMRIDRPTTLYLGRWKCKLSPNKPYSGNMGSFYQAMTWACAEHHFDGQVVSIAGQSETCATSSRRALRMKHVSEIGRISFSVTVTQGAKRNTWVVTGKCVK